MIFMKRLIVGTKPWIGGTSGQGMGDYGME